jgi:hypothetical protein
MSAALPSLQNRRHQRRRNFPIIPSAWRRSRNERFSRALAVAPLHLDCPCVPSNNGSAPGRAESTGGGAYEDVPHSCPIAHFAGRHENDCRLVSDAILVANRRDLFDGRDEGLCQPLADWPDPPCWRRLRDARSDFRRACRYAYRAARLHGS